MPLLSVLRAGKIRKLKMDTLLPFFQSELEANFGYDDDTVIEQLKVTKGIHMYLKVTKGIHMYLKVTKGIHMYLKVTKGIHMYLKVTKGIHMLLCWWRNV